MGTVGLNTLLGFIIIIIVTNILDSPKKERFHRRHPK
jgi:hypothetical protein